MSRSKKQKPRQFDDGTHRTVHVEGSLQLKYPRLFYVRDRVDPERTIEEGFERAKIEYSSIIKNIPEYQVKPMTRMDQYTGERIITHGLLYITDISLMYIIEGKNPDGSSRLIDGDNPEYDPLGKVPEKWGDIDDIITIKLPSLVNFFNSEDDEILVVPYQKDVYIKSGKSNNIIESKVTVNKKIVSLPDFFTKSELHSIFNKYSINPNYPIINIETKNGIKKAVITFSSEGIDAKIAEAMNTFENYEDSENKTKYLVSFTAKYRPTK
jgi:hypothetical protein